MEEEKVVRYSTFPGVITELEGMKSFDDFSKTDVAFSSSKIDDLEAAARTLLEATSWMNWWTYAAKSLALRDRFDMAKIKRFFIAGARCQVQVTKTASTIWVKTLFKHCDAILDKMKDNINLESFMELCNTPLSISTELFPQSA